MKAIVKVVTSEFDNRYPRRTSIQMETDDLRIWEITGHEVYVYPKSRWGMFIDWLLRA